MFSGWRPPAQSTCNLSSLIACQKQGNAWEGKLYASAPYDQFVSSGKCLHGCAKGEWYSTCSEVHREAAACVTPSRQLIVLTHLPKAGGSSLGEFLKTAFEHVENGHAGAACRFFWNGKSTSSVCRGLREWILNRKGHEVPLLPFGKPGSAAPIGDGSLESALPFRNCAFLWAQHMDFSLVEQIRVAFPAMRVRPITVIRHPVPKSNAFLSSSLPHCYE